MSQTKTSRNKRRRRMMRRLLPVLIIGVVILALLVGVLFALINNQNNTPTGGDSNGGDGNGTGEPPVTTTTTALATMSQETVTQLDTTLSATHMLLYDATNDRVLYEKEADVVCAPASLTKIMTAAVAAKYNTPESTFVVGTEVYLKDPDASSAYLKLGMELTLPQMTQALLLPSGGDAAYCLAAHTARRVYPEEQMSDFEAATRFCELMNEELKAIGAENSRFMNPDGMHHTFHVTTAEDMLKILQFAWQFDAVREALCAPQVAFTTVDGKELSYTNTNRLLNPRFPSLYYQHVLGGKTGFTDQAGYCLASVAEKDGVRLFAVVLGCADENLRFTESTALYEAGFALNP